MRDAGLNCAIDAAAGVAQLARKIGIAQPSVSNWNRVPARRAIAVEAATGVSRKQLRPDLYSEPAVTDDAVDPIDAARAREYALLAALLSSAPSNALLGDIAQIAWRRNAARSRPCRARRGCVAGRPHERRARIFRPVRRSRAWRTVALRILLSDRLSQRASAVAPARRSRRARHRAGREQFRAGGSCGDAVRDHGGPCRRALPGIGGSAARVSSRSMWRRGWAACSPTWRPRRAPNSTDRSDRLAACFWKSKPKHLRSRTDQRLLVRERCDEETKRKRQSVAAISFAMSASARSAPARRWQRR